MRLRLLLATTAALVGWSTALAAGHEVDRQQLRDAVANGRAIPFSRLQDKVESRMRGALLDVGLYEVGALYYRVLVRRPDGRVVSAVMDARTGEFLPVSSAAAQSVQQTARSDNRSGGFLGLFSIPSAPGTTGVDRSAQGTAGSAAAQGSTGRGSTSTASSNLGQGGSDGNASAGNSGNAADGGTAGNSSGGGGNGNGNGNGNGGAGGNAGGNGSSASSGGGGNGKGGSGGNGSNASSGGGNATSASASGGRSSDGSANSAGSNGNGNASGASNGNGSNASSKGGSSNGRGRD